MGATSTVTYQGSLRTSAEHLRSGNNIITDAPVDNNGKGEAFSPTDLVATSLASCMITIMGIKADRMDLDIKGASASVVKVMASGPRRIEEIQIQVTMPANNFQYDEKEILEKVAKTCPVALSIHPDTKQIIDFIWS